jgi:hypothetical protein
MVALAPTARAKDIKSEYQICKATPDGPVKQACMKKLQPAYKGKAFSVKYCAVKFWVEDFLAIDDYLKIHDADYEKALKMLQVMTDADSAYREHGEGYSGYIGMAGYYNSQGSEWKPWVKTCQELAKFVLHNPS